MNWSEDQQRFYDFIEFDKGSCVLNSVAGSGKTTTAVEGGNRILPGARAIFLAFNKNIQLELASRLPPNITARTLNSVGNSAWLKCLDTRFIKLDGRKTWGILSEMMAPDQRKMYGAGINKLVAIAKAHGIVPRRIKGAMALTLDTEQNWVDLMEHYDVEFEGKADPLQSVKYARKVLSESIKQGEKLIDFNDQLYLPVIWQARFDQFDCIFGDEIQDWNYIQRSIVKMMLAPGGRFFGVGDPCQAIYGFRGADTESIAHIEAEFNAVSLHLSKSYRCPRAVVAQARQYVSHIEPTDEAPEGKVAYLDTYGPNSFTARDAIVCRNNAPLIDLAFTLIQSGKPCKVLGRDIGQGLVRLIKQVGDEFQSLDELELALARHFERESQKLLAKGKEEQAARLEDKVICINLFIRRMPENKRTVEELIIWIDRIFADDANGMLVLSTVHKAKGLEWDRVFILEPALMPSKYARQQWQVQQENNIAYVAVTRAKSELYYINLKDFRDAQ